MNIELQCCGLGMLVVLFLIFIKEKSLDYSGRRRFMFATIFCMVCLVFDITSLVFIKLATEGVVTREVATIVCKIYLITLVQQAYQGFRYAAGDFFAAGQHKKTDIFYILWFLVGSIVILVLPLDFLQDGRIAYSFGASAYATYATVLFLMGSSIFMAFRSTYRVLRRNSILIWQGSWIVAAILQLLIPELLLVGFAAAFGIVLIYTELENPHEGIDRLTGQFTANALISYSTDLYTNKKKFATVTYRIEYANQNVSFEATKSVLIAVAKVLDSAKDCFTFRYSDKLFVVIYKDAENAKAAYADIQRKVDEKSPIPVKISVVSAPDSEIFDSSDEYLRFLHYCDVKMQAADLIVMSEDLLKELRRYSETVALIRSALEEDRVIVYLQPIYNVQKGTFNSAEALVRIIDKDGNLISPGQFIPVAEQSGLIVPLGKEVFKKTCEFLADGRARALGLDYIEINLSPVQFDENDPAGFVQHYMKEYDIKPEWINLEITETDSDSVKQFFLKNMEKLIDRGITFSLDDFGTGRSNLDYFVAMPVSIIKFDYTFTQSYFKNEKAKYVMESVVGLMSRMGLAIVAEGVETKEQLEAMLGLGVSYIQGYYFSRPIPTDDFIEFIKAHNAV